MSKKLMFVVNVDWFFISHRLPIALEAMRQGFEVHVAVGITDQKKTMEGLGLIVHPIKIDRSSTNLLDTLKTLWQIILIFRKVRPDVIHLVTIKPVLLGGIAARVAGIRGVVAAIPGLGYVFLDRGWLSRIRRKAVINIYRMALNHHTLKVIFQNTDDCDRLIGFTRLSNNNVEMIRGSGVDLIEFSYAPLPEGAPVVLLAGRLLADKGVREFVNAARLLLIGHRDVRFCLVGIPDPDNPSSIKESDLSEWVKEGFIEWWGHRSDMVNVLRLAHIVVLPSYSEGLPKVLIEAAAVGRAVVTTDVPGCRDAIEPDKTGILVPPKNVELLAVAIEYLLVNPQRCREMGLAGRKLAEREFDIKQVVAAHMRIYQSLV